MKKMKTYCNEKAQVYKALEYLRKFVRKVCTIAGLKSCTEVKKRVAAFKRSPNFFCFLVEKSVLKLRCL